SSSMASHLSWAVRPTLITSSWISSESCTVPPPLSCLSRAQPLQVLKPQDVFPLALLQHAADVPYLFFQGRQQALLQGVHPPRGPADLLCKAGELPVQRGGAKEQ